VTTNALAELSALRPADPGQSNARTPASTPGGGVAGQASLCPEIVIVTFADDGNLDPSRQITRAFYTTTRCWSISLQRCARRSVQIIGDSSDDDDKCQVTGGLRQVTPI
jgi:hypothetical protein